MSDIERRGDRSPVPTDWTYAPAPESTEIVRLQERYGIYVGGEWLETTERFTTVAPRDESPLAEVAQASEEDVRNAVAVAREAFRPWSKLRAANGRSTCSGSRASSPSAAASSRCSRA